MEMDYFMWNFCFSWSKDSYILVDLDNKGEDNGVVTYSRVVHEYSPEEQQ